MHGSARHISIYRGFADGCARQNTALRPVQGHKFVKFDDRIVVVDPASRLVVAMIPRYKLVP
jgi:hypothetical protein